MLSKKIQDALNKQINAELYSSYLYLAMQAYFEGNNLPGSAHWMKLQSEEEWRHGLKIFDFVYNRQGTVALSAIQQPSSNYKSPLDVFQKAYEHEKTVTNMIHRLYDLAVKENDYSTQVMLNWFVDEQVEEEKQALVIVEQLKRIGNDAAALIILDKELAERK